MIAKKEVTDAIAQAFKRAKMPRSQGELTTGGIDGPNVVRNFLGKSQQDVDSSEFRASLYMEDYSYMTIMAVEYYLPCALRAMLNTPYDDELWIYLYSFLKRNRKGKLKWGLQDLDSKQMKAIHLWATYLYEQWQINPQNYIEDEEALSLTRAYQ